MNNVVPPTLDRLLEERVWLARLARHLVRDPEAADDVEQETWLHAVGRPPTDARSPRGWLATVLHRAVGRRRRDAFRRDQRERAVARPAAVAPTADVVASAELHRHVVDAVLALAEPFRTAVLLRFFEGCPPREIARRTGTSPETARSRVRRGVEALRATLTHDGNRRARLVAHAATFAPEDDPGDAPNAGDATPGGPRVRIPIGRGLAFVAALGAVGALLLVRGAGAPEVGEGPEDGAAAPAPALVGSRAPASSSPSLAVAGPGTDAARGARDRAGTAGLIGRVRRDDGTAVGAAQVEVWRTLASESAPLRLATTVADTDGRFEFAELAGGEVTLLARAPGLAMRRVGTLRREGSNVCAVTLRPGATVERDVVLAAAATLEGIVTEEDLVLASAVQVALELWTGDGSNSWVTVDETTVAPDGTFALRSVPREAQVRVVARRAGRWGGYAGPWWSPDDLPSSLRLLLRPIGLRTVTITVRDAATGAAVPGALVFLGEATRDPSMGDRFLRSASADAAGRAVFDGAPTVALVASASLQPPGTDVRTRKRTGKVDVGAGVGAAEVVLGDAPDPLGASARSRLRLNRVRVVGPDGAPVPDATVAAYRWADGGGGAGWGRLRGGEGDAGAGWPPARVAEAFAAADATGAPLPYGAATAEFDAEGLAAIRLPAERRSRGRVLDVDGSPAEGVLVRFVPTRWVTSSLPLAGHAAHARARTGPDGRFDVGQLADESYDVLVVAPVDRAAPPPARVDAGDGAVELRLRPAGTAVIRVVAGGDTPVGAAVVQVWPSGGGLDARTAPPFVTATTDARGVARLPGLDVEAPHRLEVRPPAGDRRLVRVERFAWIPAAAPTVDLAAVVRVTVVDAAGRPVPRARVVEPGRDGDPIERCVADDLGRATWADPGTEGGRLLALPPGVDVDAEALRASRAARPARPGDDVALVVFPGVRVEIELVGGPSDAPVEVDSFARDREGTFHADRWPTPRDGRVAGYVDALGARRWVLARDRARTRVGYAPDVPVDAGPVRVEMRDARSLSGRVAAPSSVGAIEVRVSQLDGPVWERVTADERGAWAVHGLPPGRYVVSASPRDGDGSLEDRREADAGATVDLTLR